MVLATAPNSKELKEIMKWRERERSNSRLQLEQIEYEEESTKEYTNSLFSKIKNYAGKVTGKAISLLPEPVKKYGAAVSIATILTAAACTPSSATPTYEPAEPTVVAATATPAMEPRETPIIILTPTLEDRVTPTPEPATATPTSEPKQPPTTTEPYELDCPGCEESLEFHYNNSPDFFEALTNQPWFKDGINNNGAQFDEVLFIKSLRYLTKVPEINDIISSPQDHFVNGSIDTMTGKADVVIIYVPEKTSERTGKIIRTDRKTAENVLNLYRAQVSLLEQYLDAPYFENSWPPNLYTIFINSDDMRVNAHGYINSSSNRITLTHAHETTHRYHFGPAWMNEGSAAFIPLSQYGNIPLEAKSTWSGLNAPRSVDSWYNILKEKLENTIIYLRQDGSILYPWSSDETPDDTMREMQIADVTLEDMANNEVGKPIQEDAGFIFLVDLGRLIGDNAMRDGYRELIKLSNEKSPPGQPRNDVVAKEIYNIFKKYTPQDKLNEFDNLWETKVFGTELFSGL